MFIFALVTLKKRSCSIKPDETVDVRIQRSSLFSRYCPNRYGSEVPGVYHLNVLCKLLIRVAHDVSELAPMRLQQLLSPSLFLALFTYRVGTIHSCFLPALDSALLSTRKCRCLCKEGCCGELGSSGTDSMKIYTQNWMSGKPPPC